MIDFLKYRLVCLVASVLFITALIGTYIYKNQKYGHAFSYSIDFTGGTQVLFRFSQPVSSTELTDILVSNGWSNPTIREFSGNTDLIVRIKEFTSDISGIAEQIKQAINKALPSVEVTILQSESVGAGVGADLRWKSICAVIIALLAMLLYIAIRFWSFSFAVGAVAALFHDALIMLGMLLFFDREISINVIGAILAVLGYSVNDTIVIFASIRDHLAAGLTKSSLATIVNESLNRTLRRTLLTSFFTALTVCSMLFLGGQALRDFSLTLLIGIVFGTYSSIYIASPVMMLLYKKD